LDELLQVPQEKWQGAQTLLVTKPSESLIS